MHNHKEFLFGTGNTIWEGSDWMVALSLFGCKPNISVWIYGFNSLSLFLIIIWNCSMEAQDWPTHTHSFLFSLFSDADIYSHFVVWIFSFIFSFILLFLCYTLCWKHTTFYNMYHVPALSAKVYLFLNVRLLRQI